MDSVNYGTTAIVERSTIFGDIKPCGTCFHTGTLLGLFDPEDGDDMFLRNVV
jgi:hypothetical protein